MVNTVIYRETHLSAEHGRYYRLKKAQHPPTRRSPPVTICVTISSPAVGAHQLPATRLPRRAQRGRGLMMRWDLLPCHSRWESRPQLQLNLSTRPCLKSLQTGNEDIGEAPRTENQTEVQGEHRKGFLYKTRCHKWWRACSSPHTLMPQVYPSTTQSIHVSRYKETRQSSRKTQFYFTLNLVISATRKAWMFSFLVFHLSCWEKAIKVIICSKTIITTTGAATLLRMKSAVCKRSHISWESHFLLLKTTDMENLDLLP